LGKPVQQQQRGASVIDAGTSASDDLPIPDFDHLAVGSLEHRIRSLDAAAIERLIDHERSHSRRQRLLLILQSRLDALHSGAQPSGGSASTGATDLTTAGMSGESSVSPATEGPPVNPPSQGVPTNPAQPRSTG
jgi:hypothetical protein